MDRTAEPVASPHDPGLLAAYVEGRLDDEERRVMTVHLASCVECRQALAMLARVPAVRPQATRRRPVTAPVWLGLAATVVLVTLAVRRTDAPVPVGEVRPPASVRPAPPAATVPSPEVVTATPMRSSPPADPMLDPGLLVKRGASPQRHVGAKAFRLVAGEWVDAGFDPAGSLPTTVVKGPEERALAVKRRPALEPYAALGDRVVVVLDGVVYRFAPEEHP